MFPLSLSDGLCRGQTASPAAGTLQTIVLILLFCSPTSIQLLTFCLRRAAVTNEKNCKQEENKGESKKGCFTCTFIHQTSRCTCYPTDDTLTHSFNLRAAFMVSSRLPLLSLYLSPSFTLSSRHPSISPFFLSRFSSLTSLLAQ